MPNVSSNQYSARLRLVAPGTILRSYLPALLKEHRRKYPNLTLQLHDANHSKAERLLQKHEINLAVTELEGKPVAGLNSAILFKLPLALIACRSDSRLEWRQICGAEAGCS